MTHSEQNDTASAQRDRLFTLCRFLGIRLSYRIMLLLLSGTGLLLTVLEKSQFAPYGIALICLLLPVFLSGAEKEPKEKENSDLALSALFKRYHYSPVMYVSYRITYILCMLLLLIWHLTQATPLTLFGVSVPLLYLALGLALSVVLGRVLFFLFHRRLMNGIL
ncbi:MAG: hypothetical protein IKT67_08425 [Lachnospiraceae bacterium]|nr:hypothetical protein [Lachnospiraceae bacterium]